MASLAGLSVLIARSVGQQSELTERLDRLGATVIAVPVLAIAPPQDDGRSLRDELARLETFDWLVVTSPNGARAVIAGLSERRPKCGMAAIGPGTAEVLVAAGIEVALIPDRSVGEGLVEAFPNGDGATVLVAQAEAARPVVADGLRAKGYDVTSVVAYRSVDATVDDRQRQRATNADVVLFTSSSTVQRFLRLLGADAVPPAVGVIGPVTADTARDAGITVDFVASPHTLDGLVDALVRWVEASRVGE